MSIPAQGQPNAPSTSLWRTIRHSLSGRRCDYTNEPLERALLLLAVPMMLEMLMESLFALSTVFWVARFGTAAVAVVGLTEAMMTVVYATAIGFSLPAGAIIARRIGEGSAEAASHVAAQVVMLALSIPVAVGGLLSYFARDVLELMGATPSIVAVGLQYTSTMLGFNCTVFMIFVINAIFRGAGDSVIAMQTLWLANLVNIALSPLLIFGYGPFPEMGVSGAAVATNIGRGIGVLYQLWHLSGYRSRIRIQLHHLRPNREILRSLIALALSGVAQRLIITSSWLGLFKILAIVGSSAVAGFTIAMRILNFAVLIAMGLANASATLVGQNLGAMKPERAEAAVKIALRYNVALLCLIGSALVMLCDPLVRLFTADSAVASHASRALQIVGIGLPMYGAGYCLLAAFNGAGDTATPTRLNFYCFWLGQIPLSWVLAHTMDLGSTGVFIAVLLSFSALTVWSAVLFRRGDWKLRRL